MKFLFFSSNYKNISKFKIIRMQTCGWAIGGNNILFCSPKSLILSSSNVNRLINRHSKEYAKRILVLVIVRYVCINSRVLSVTSLSACMFSPRREFCQLWKLPQPGLIIEPLTMICHFFVLRESIPLFILLMNSRVQLLIEKFCILIELHLIG